MPCGNGCVPPTAVCCDDGTGKTTSYCTNQAGSCFVNSRDCQAVFPAGQKGAFCCGPSGTIGSNDCPEGQRHCGLLCQPESQSCCPSGSTAADCPTTTWDEAGCTSAKAGWVRCGVCTEKKVCFSCAPQYCCSGDPCGEHACLPGTACTGTGAGGGGGSTDSCSSFTKERCCTGGGGISVVACYVAPPCGCPSGTTTGPRQGDGTTMCRCP